MGAGTMYVKMLNVAYRRTEAAATSIPTFQVQCCMHAWPKNLKFNCWRTTFTCLQPFLANHTGPVLVQFFWNSAVAVQQIAGQSELLTCIHFAHVFWLYALSLIFWYSTCNLKAHHFFNCISIFVHICFDCKFSGWAFSTVIEKVHNFFNRISLPQNSVNPFILAVPKVSETMF